MTQVTAGFISQVEGMNEGIVPTLLKDTSYARGINVACRGGSVSTRPGFRLISGSLPQGVFQGAGRWSLNSTDYLVGVSSGHVFVVRTDDGSVVDMGLLLDENQQCFFAQVDRYMVIQNGINTAVVLGLLAGSVYQVPTELIQLPPGTIMQFAHGRLHYVPAVVPGTSDSGRPYFISSDISLPNNTLNVFNYTEAQYLNEGGAHGLPMELGYIGGLGTFRNAQTGTGVGEVLVFARNGVAAFDLSLPRSYWTSQPLSSVLFFGNGTVAPWSVCNVNNDVVYRALDGMRTIRYTASITAGNTGALANNPMSVEAASFYRDEPLGYQQFVSSAFVDNRLFMTAIGTSGSYFKGIVSLDTAVLSSMGQTTAPAYDGLWTGMDFAQVIMALSLGKPTAYVFSKGPVLYKVDPSLSADMRLDGSLTPITSTHITGTYAFTDSKGAPTPFDRKSLDYVELWLSGLRRDTTISIYYRPGRYPFWTHMATRTITIKGGDAYPQYTIDALRFSRDLQQVACDPVTGEPLWSANDFQFAIVTTGCMTIERMRAAATVLVPTLPDPCDEVTEIALTPGETSGIVLSDFNYTVEES